MDCLLLRKIVSFHLVSSAFGLTWLIASTCINSVQRTINVRKSRALGSCLFVIENLSFLNGNHTNLTTTCISTWYKYHLLPETMLVWVHLVLKPISYQWSWCFCVSHDYSFSESFVNLWKLKQLLAPATNERPKESQTKREKSPLQPLRWKIRAKAGEKPLTRKTALPLAP